MVSMRVFERELSTELHNYYGEELISIIVEGSYGSGDFVKGYSDYDCLVFLKGFSKGELDPNCRNKIKTEFQLRYLPWDYFIEAVEGIRLKRHLGPLELIKMKYHSRIIYGKDILTLIPDKSLILSRYNSILGEYLRAAYYHATNIKLGWNIFKKPPKKWVNYIINMSYLLLIAKGTIVNKKDIVTFLQKEYSDFECSTIVANAIMLRQTKQVLNLTPVEARKLKQHLRIFLDNYWVIVERV
jgi:predicted nucleotidyltransferase